MRSDEKHENWILNQLTDIYLLAKIHGYLLGVKTINTLILGLQKNLCYAMQYFLQINH